MKAAKFRSAAKVHEVEIRFLGTFSELQSIVLRMPLDGSWDVVGNQFQFLVSSQSRLAYSPSGLVDFLGWDSGKLQHEFLAACPRKLLALHFLKHDADGHRRREFFGTLQSR